MAHSLYGSAKSPVNINFNNISTMSCHEDWTYKPAQGGLKIVYKLPGLFLHIIMGSNGFIVIAYPTTKPESHYGSQGYTLSNQTPGFGAFKWQATTYYDDPFKWNNRFTNNPSTYPLRRTTSFIKPRPKFNLMPTRRYPAMPKRYNMHNLKWMRPRGYLKPQ